MYLVTTILTKYGKNGVEKDDASLKRVQIIRLSIMFVAAAVAVSSAIGEEKIKNLQFLIYNFLKKSIKKSYQNLVY